MPERRTTFDEAAQAASLARIDAERELAASLVRELQADPARFDPRRLASLGTTGLADVLRSFDVPDPIEPVLTVGSEAEPTDLVPQVDWSALRRRELPAWIVGPARGLIAGIILIALGSIARVVLS